jgi:hypothetical protein
MVKNFKPIFGYDDAGYDPDKDQPIFKNSVGRQQLFKHKIILKNE